MDHVRARVCKTTLTTLGQTTRWSAVSSTIATRRREHATKRCGDGSCGRTPDRTCLALRLLQGTWRGRSAGVRQQRFVLLQWPSCDGAANGKA